LQSIIVGEEHLHVLVERCALFYSDNAPIRAVERLYEILKWGVCGDDFGVYRRRRWLYGGDDFGVYRRRRFFNQSMLAEEQLQVSFERFALFYIM
jgi:hypothetical protein